MRYVVLDIGCIECGEPSTILGIFDGERKAKEVMKKYKQIQVYNWTGQHDFEIIEVKEENIELYDEKSYLKHIEW